MNTDIFTAVAQFLTVVAQFLTSVTQFVIAKAQVLTAIGTILLAILVIYGDAIKIALFAPKLKLTLRDPAGHPTQPQHDEKQSAYYHICVSNKSTRCPAESVRILLVGLSRKQSDGTFKDEKVPVPLQLRWSSYSVPEMLPTIPTGEDFFCDLGHLETCGDQGKFTLDFYVNPSNINYKVEKGETIRVNLRASAHTLKKPRWPYVLEISWDGKWSNNDDERKRYLIIKEVKHDDVKSS